MFFGCFGGFLAVFYASTGKRTVLSILVTYKSRTSVLFFSPAARSGLAWHSSCLFFRDFPLVIYDFFVEFLQLFINRGLGILNVILRVCTGFIVKNEEFQTAGGSFLVIS